MGEGKEEKKKELRVIHGLKSLSAFGEWDADKSMWLRELPTPWGGSNIVVHEDPNRAGIGGEFFLWPASLVLCDYIFRNPSVVREQSVVELGSSHGLAAMAAQSAGSSRVIATDQTEVLPFLSENVAANPAHKVDVAALEWGVCMESWGVQHGWDWGIVVGSDLTFNRSCFLPLLYTLQELTVRSISCKGGEGACKILLLHDDDSVPGGKSLRIEFFERAALPYFSVERADLRETEGHGCSSSPRFHSETVHGYWLAHRHDAQHIAAVDCAGDLTRWQDARRTDNAESAQSTHVRRPGLGITLPELLAHFQQSSSAPMVPEGSRPRDRDMKDSGAGRGKKKEVSQDSMGSCEMQDSMGSCETVPSLPRESLAMESAQRRLDPAGPQDAKTNWWDEELTEPEPFDFTEEMLRGVAETGNAWDNLKADAADWDAMVAAEEAAAAKNAAGAWRHLSVDMSSLPALNGTSDDEGDEGDDAEAVVDIDALRTAAWHRAKLNFTGNTAGNVWGRNAPSDAANLEERAHQSTGPGPVSPCHSVARRPGVGASGSRGPGVSCPVSTDAALSRSLDMSDVTSAGAKPDGDRKHSSRWAATDGNPRPPPRQDSGVGQVHDPDLDELD